MVALAYHAREHGFASQRRFVLVQGTASYDAHPDRAVLENVVGPAVDPVHGRAAQGTVLGPLAARLLRRPRARAPCRWSATSLARPRLRRRARGVGSARAGRRSGRADAAEGRRRAARGRGPRGAAVAPLPHALVAYPGADGFPLIVPVTIGADSAAGIALEGPLAAGGRRAGLLAHRYEAQLIGLETRQHTGWLPGRRLRAPYRERLPRAREQDVAAARRTGCWRGAA